MKLIAVDPGSATGIAVWYDGDFSSYEKHDPMEAVDDIVSHLHEVDEVVCENFKPRPKVTWQPDALHIIGALRYHCWLANVPLELPLPAGKDFGTDARLKRAGFYVPGQGHANDAARHLLKRLVRRKLIALEDVL